jgi:hypothetical protein
LTRYNTGAPLAKRAMAIVLASLITATAVLGAWTLVILKARRQACGCHGYSSSACQRSRPEALVETARFVGASL